LIHKWKRAALTKGDGTRSGTELSEIELLKKRNRELEQENEILKKAALIFGRGS
jgi:transposase-like protein